MTAGGALSHSSSLRGPRGSVSVSSDAPDDAEWLESPSDLICPITHEREQGKAGAQAASDGHGSFSHVRPLGAA